MTAWSPIIAHGYAGSPLYSFGPSAGGMLLGFVGGWMAAGAITAVRPEGRIAAWFDSAPTLDRWSFRILAAVLGGAIGFLPGAGALAPVAITATLGMAITLRSLVGGGRWRRLLWSSMVAQAIAALLVATRGVAIDQTMIVLFTGQISAAALSRPRETGRMRGAMTTLVIVGAVMAVGGIGWGSGLAAGNDAERLGDTPPPGVLLPHGEDRPATAAERAAAFDLQRRTAQAVAKYQDLAVAAADGYDVSNVHGLDFHASNPAYEKDGRILDPARPESLMYSVGPDGPVLTAVVFEMPDATPGPTPGGPLMVWHAHDHVCFSLIPPGLTGIATPWGGCPVGSITVAKTNEMIHLWVYDGAPKPFGHIDDAVIERYLADRSANR